MNLSKQKYFVGMYNLKKKISKELQPRFLPVKDFSPIETCLISSEQAIYLGSQLSVADLCHGPPQT